MPSSKTVSSGDGRPGRRPERAGRRAGDGCGCGGAAGMAAGRAGRRDGERRRDRRLPLQAREQRLPDVFLGLDQGAGPIDVGVRLARSRRLRHHSSPSCDQRLRNQARLLTPWTSSEIGFRCAASQGSPRPVDRTSRRPRAGRTGRDETPGSTSRPPATACDGPVPSSGRSWSRR